MLCVNFNAYASYVTDSLYQWDINQDLVINGLGLSVAPEIHFANADMDRAIVRQSTLERGVVTVRIPNSLLQAALTIKAYVGIYEGETFKVIETIEIPVIAKTKPADYTIEDSDEEIYSFKALENEIANSKKEIAEKCDANLVALTANVQAAKTDFESDVEEITKTLNARVDNIIARNNDTNGNTELVDLRVDHRGNIHASAGDAIRTQFSKIEENCVTNDELFRGYDTKTVRDKVVILSERDPHITSLVSQTATIHGRNFFDINSATFANINGYGSQTPYTIENNGIKIATSLTTTSANVVKMTEIIAPFTGTMYVSCEADCDGDIRDLAFFVKVNGVNQTICYGKGLLYEAVEVIAGDIVGICFYCHMSTPTPNNLYYKNIQVSYGGLYDFKPYIAPIISKRAVKSVYVLPTEAKSWVASSTANGNHRWVIDTGIIDMASYPENAAIPSGVTVEGTALVTYNQTYQNVEGVGISSTGKVSLYLADVQSSAVLETYLTENPITIYYDNADPEFEIVNIEKTAFLQGEVLEFETVQEVTYKYETQEKNLTCVCFGDSITGMFVNKTDYPSMIERDTDIICHNVGFSGTQLTDHSSATYRPFSLNRLVDAIVSGDFSSQEANVGTNAVYVERLNTLKSLDFSKIDFVTILYGTNDWYSDKILKSADDTTTENKERTNVEDALKYSVNKLLTAYPHLQIIVLTPYWRSVSGGDSDIGANGNGVYLYEYADHIQKVAEETYHLPTINLYRTAGVNAITNRYFTNDGTHPNERMKRIIANKIIRTITENR